MSSESTSAYRMIDKHERHVPLRITVPTPLQSWLLQFLGLIPGLIFMIDMVMKGSAVTPTGRQFTLADDVMISMTYARTLARTGEWVWYPGAPFVEGFTNFLWTLYMTLLHTLGLEGSQGSLAIALTGVAIIAALAVLMGRWALLAIGRGWTSVAAAVTITAFVPFLYPLTYWTLRGYEVGILTLLAAVIGYSATQFLTASPSRSAWLLPAGVAAAMGVLIRMDFLAISMAVSAAMLVTPASRDTRVRATLSVALPAITALIVVATFQRFYWGSFMPNTYALKVEGFSSLEKWSRGAASLGVSAPAIVLGGLALLATFVYIRRKQARIAALLAGSIAAVSVTYNIWTGGDAWEWLVLSNRYLAVALPFFLFATVTAIALLTRSSSFPSPPAIVVSIAILTISAIAIGIRTNPFSYDNHRVVAMTAIVSIGAGIAIAATRVARHGKYRGISVGTAVLASGLTLVLTIATWPAVNYLQAGQAQLVGEDLNRTRDGLDLGAVTTPDATIAVLPAGSVPYYAERPTIDLLGKSDAIIAALPPASVPDGNPMANFFPGHNKWNYEYSIRELRPDVVYSPNYDFVGFESLESWGYVPLCSVHNVRSYFLASSQKINWSKLQPC